MMQSRTQDIYDLLLELKTHVKNITLDCDLGGRVVKDVEYNSDLSIDLQFDY
jgi:hypothetical protein